MVFNVGANQPIGFYYWNGATWTAVGGGSASGNYWDLLGNASTVDGTNFIGTTDNVPINFRVNNQKAGRVTSSGSTFLGYQAGISNLASTSTAVGYQALFNNTLGSYNSAFGYNSGPNAANMSNTTSLGYNAIATANNQVVLGDANVTSLFCMGAYNSASPNVPNLYVDASGQIMRSANVPGPGWLLTGNAGTTVGTNFIGTTDNVSFAINTNNTERMRIEDDGEVVVGNTVAVAGDIFSVYGVAGNYGINSYGSSVGIFSTGSSISVQGELDNASGLPGYFRNYNATGTGLVAMGNGNNYLFYAAGSGASFYGFHGLFSKASDAAGTGVFSSGNNLNPVGIPTGSGGSFYGYHGIYGKGNDATVGTGVIGTGNNLGTFTTLLNGSGGTFYGYDGLLGKASNNSGMGVVGLGNNGSTYYYIPAGSGGAFTGFHGVYGQAINTGGTGVVGNGNNSATTYYVTGGSGGAFTGNNGLISTATTAAGTGVIGSGSGVLTYTTLAGGSGGAFTANVCGVYGYASNSSGDRYGGYFATGGGRYAYVGGRYSGTDRKIVGNGTVSTIVKNTKGESVTLVCPEAPEAYFQDFGIGQLENGFAHITIDPDLAININVSEDHPLKVFVTLEGDCNGVYVTNKSANGFDVIELQGGISNVDFSWQIVAIRANEEYTLRDGTTEISDYSQRFQPAPPPLEQIQEDSRSTTQNKSINSSANTIDFPSIEIKPINSVDSFNKDAKHEMK
jgi:hypothetical protein